jgi:hypothetical protein
MNEKEADWTAARGDIGYVGGGTTLEIMRGAPAGSLVHASISLRP